MCRRAHRIPEWLTYAGLRYFHAPSAAVMAPTPTIGADLTRRGFSRVRLWTRGVNHAVYRPRPKRALDLPRPIFLSVGRVAVEKNLEALLGLDLPGSTVIVGDGPVRGQPRAPLSPRAFSRRQTRRSAGRHLCERRRIRLPLAHRHVRDRDDRGYGERLAGRGFSRARADRRRRRPAPGCSTRI